MRLALIGGTGVYDPEILADLREERVETPYGQVLVQVGRFRGEEIAFMARHGEGHRVPPHRINYRANIWALRLLGAERVVTTAATGTMNPELAPGEFVFVDQFIDFTRNRTYTFYEGGEAGVAHVDFSEPYCPELRRTLAEAAMALDMKHHPAGCYVCTEGPRFETPAEIRMFRQLGGDLVGMTNVPEAVLAREAGLCYATVAMPTNWAAGISATPLTHQEVVEVMAQNTARVRALIMEALVNIPRERACRCREGAEQVMSS